MKGVYTCYCYDIDEEGDGYSLSDILDDTDNISSMDNNSDDKTIPFRHFYYTINNKYILKICYDTLDIYSPSVLTIVRTKEYYKGLPIYLVTAKHLKDTDRFNRFRRTLRDLENRR